MSLKLLLALVIACGATGVARADERTAFVEVVPTAPFDASELAAALQLRMPSRAAAIRIRVTSVPGGVRIEARGNAREIALGSLTGSAAARLVALAASDLLLDDLASTPAGAAPVSAATARDASPVRAALPRSMGETTVGALGGAALWPQTLDGVTVDVAVRRGSHLLAIDAGGGALVGGPLQLTAATVRIGGGLTADPLELRAGATFVPLIVDTGAGDQTILVGGGASVRVRIPIAAAVRAVLATGIDVFANRSTYVVDGMQILVTPRAAPWIAAGLEVMP